MPIRNPSASGAVDGLLRLAAARNGPSTRWCIRAIATYAMSRLAMVSLTPRRCRARLTAPIQVPPTRAAAATMPPIPRAPGSAGYSMAKMPAATPPSTTAPSPPIMIMPRRAGSAVHRAASSRGAVRASVFSQANALPKAAW